MQLLKYRKDLVSANKTQCAGEHSRRYCSNERLAEGHRLGFSLALMSWSNQALLFYSCLILHCQEIDKICMIRHILGNKKERK